jgi:hypothetical protein
VRTDIDLRLHELALGQYGAVGQWQAASLEIDGATWRRRRSGSHWNVATSRVIVSASAPESFEQQLSIARLDAGPGAALSHPTATNVYDLSGFTQSPIHVSRPRRNAHTPPEGVKWHHPRLLPAHHILVVNGLPVTSPARMVADLAGLRGVHAEKARRIADSAWAAGLVTRSHLERMAEEWCERGRRGSTWLKEYLESRPADWTAPASNVARRFVELIKQAGMPEPRSEVNVGSDVSWLGRVDCLDPELPLIAEIDSDRFHVAPLDQEADAHRDIEMGAAKFHVIRFTEQEVWYDGPGTVLRWRNKRNEVRRLRAS